MRGRALISVGHGSAAGSHREDITMFGHVASQFGSAFSRAKSRHDQRRFRPAPEVLEVRSLLSTLSIALVTDNPHLGAPSKLGPTPAVFRITRDGDLSSLPLHYGGTAQRGVDFVTWENKAVFEAGSATAYVTAMPLNDAIPDGNKTVTVTLDPVAGYTLGSGASASAKIQDYYVPGYPGVWKPNTSWGNGLN